MVIGEVTCVEGDFVGDMVDGEEAEGSIVVERRRSANEDRRSLIISLTTVIDDLRSFSLLAISVLLEDVESLLSIIFSCGGLADAIW